MSSILKALKKLEKESPQQDESVSWPQKIDTKKAISQNTRGALIFKKFIAVFFMAAVLAAGVWLFLGEKPFRIKKYFAGAGFFNKSDGEEKTASGPVRKKVEKRPVQVPRREIVEKKMPRLSARKTTRVSVPKMDTGAAKTSEKSGPVKKVDQKMLAHVRKVSEKPLKAEARGENGIDERVTISEKKSSGPGLDQRKTPAMRQAEKPDSGETAEERKFMSAKIMDDSKLELQAIAWSVDVKKRIAVVNGRVLREGATIEEFTITRIGKDEVVIMVGNEFRKLVFTTK